MTIEWLLSNGPLPELATPCDSLRRRSPGRPADHPRRVARLWHRAVCIRLAVRTHRHVIAAEDVVIWLWSPPKAFPDNNQRPRAVRRQATTCRHLRSFVYSVVCKYLETISSEWCVRDSSNLPRSWNEMTFGSHQNKYTFEGSGGLRAWGTTPRISGTHAEVINWGSSPAWLNTPPYWPLG